MGIRTHRLNYRRTPVFSQFHDLKNSKGEAGTQLNVGKIHGDFCRSNLIRCSWP